MNLRTTNKRRHAKRVKDYRWKRLWKDDSVSCPSMTRRYYLKETDRFIKYWNQYRVPGAVYHSCSLHPCYVTELDVEFGRNGRYMGGSIYGKSLLDGSEGHGCDLQHCGVYLMDDDEVARYKAAWERDGERGIVTVYHDSEEGAI